MYDIATLKYVLVSYQTPLVLDTYFLYSKVYVSTTQKNYTQGEFVANLFLQGTFHTSDAKMTGFIKTCENRAYFDQDECPYSMSFSPNEFIWPSDPSAKQILHYIGDSRFPVPEPLNPDSYRMQNGDVWVCLLGNSKFTQKNFRLGLKMDYHSGQQI